MARVIQISDNNERNDIIAFKRNGIYPTTLSKLARRNFRRKCDDLILKEDKLYVTENGIEKEMIIKTDIERKNHIISEMHSVDHIGIRPTYERIKLRYHGILIEDVKQIISACISCLRETPPAIIQSITPILPNYPRERLLVDTIDLSVYQEYNNGYRYIFTFIDSFTKYGWCYPSLRKDAQSFSQVLEKHFYSEGTWEILHTDNGGEFINNAVNAILIRFNIISTQGRPYHPQSQGQIERFNRTIKSRLRKCFSLNTYDWSSQIDRIVFWYNNSTHRATGLKPFMLFKAYEHSFTFRSHENVSNNLESARLRLIQYIETYRREYSLRSGQVLTVGDRVLLVKPYRPNYRRQAFESIYNDEIYQVLEIFNEKLILISEFNMSRFETTICNVKKIN